MGSLGQNETDGETAGSAVPGENALLLCRAKPDGEPCLAVPDSKAPDDVACLVVSLTDTVDAVVDRWRRQGGTTAGELAVVSVGETTRSAAVAAGSDGMLELTDDVTTTTVSDPGDLTGLGIRISECLRAWADRDGIVVCFDSVTSLLQFTDVKRVFQFLHVVTSRMRDAGARAHFHMDPAAHDDRTIATVRGLFDGAYERGEDGEWRER